MKHKSDLPPLRRVLWVTLRKERGPTGATFRDLHLECGHNEHRAPSGRDPKRVRCYSCWRDDS